MGNRHLYQTRGQLQTNFMALRFLLIWRTAPGTGGGVNPWDRFWASRASADDFYPQHERIEWAVRDAGTWDRRVAVEVGCGLGGSARFMLDLGMKPVLLDYSQASLDKCRERFPAGSGVALVRGDVFHLPFKDECVDLIFHQGLIEHFRGQEPRAILLENLRTLKSCGWLVVEVPQAFHWEGVLARPFIWTGTWFAGWQTYYTFPGLKRLAESLDIEKIRYFGMWMNPSFCYRALRWGLRRFFSLPLYPWSWGPTERLRRGLRRRFFYHPIAWWTGASVGFVGRKKRGGS